MIVIFLVTIYLILAQLHFQLVLLGQFLASSEASLTRYWSLMVTLLFTLNAPKCEDKDSGHCEHMVHPSCPVWACYGRGHKNMLVHLPTAVLFISSSATLKANVFCAIIDDDTLLALSDTLIQEAFANGQKARTTH